MELQNNTCEYELSVEEFAGVVGCSGGHRDEENTAEKTFLKDILSTIESTILSIEEENTCLVKNEANFTGLNRTTWNPAVLQYPTDRDQTVEPYYDSVNSSPSEDANENKVSKTMSGKAFVQQDSSSTKDLSDAEQCQYDPFECLKKSVELGIQDINYFETVAEVYENLELSNTTNVASLKSQKTESSSFDSNLSLTDLNDVEDGVHNSSRNFETNCELEMEVSTIKPCQVILKRCDSLVEEYFSKCPASYPSSLQADQISEVSNKKRGHKRVSKNLKSKQGRKKKKLKGTSVGDDSTHVVEPFRGTRTNDGIKTNVTQEEYQGNDILHLNVCNTDMNLQDEDIGETLKPTRRKRNASSVISVDNSLSIEACKKWKDNESTITENPQTLQSESNKRLHKDHNLFESADSEVDSDYSSSKENFKTAEYKKAKNLKNISSIHELTPEGIDIKLENNYSGDGIDLSELSDSSLFGSISNQQAMQCDFSSLLKPCRVVLTRMELNSDEMSFPHNATSLPSNCSVSFDLSESSGLESELETFKPIQGGKESNWMSYNVDLSSPECSFDKELKEVEKTLDSFSSVLYDDSKYQFVETTKGQSARRKMSGFSESSSTELANVPPDVSNAVEIPLPIDQSYELPKKSQKSKKCKKSQRGKESASRISPDSSGSKKCGIHRELLELYKNQFTQELKGLKNIMKRTERKLDALLKLHEQVIDFYE